MFINLNKLDGHLDVLTLLFKASSEQNAISGLTYKTITGYLIVNKKNILILKLYSFRTLLEKIISHIIINLIFIFLSRNYI